MESGKFLRDIIQRSKGIKFKTLQELAELAKVNQGNLSSFMKPEGDPKRRENMTFDTAWKILQFLDVVIPSEEKPPTIRRVGPHAPVEIVAGDNLKTIQVYASAGAGAGIAVTDFQPMFSVTAPPDYLYRCNFAVMVDGHSMEPTIPHKAVVGVLEVTEFRANELYVACIPYEGLVVKRVAVDRERGEFVFKSDNADKEAYPDFRESIEASEKIIQGRVVWIMCGY